MTSYYVIVSIKVFINVEEDECISLCTFGGRINISGFEVIDGGPPVAKKTTSTTKAGLNRVNSKTSSFVSRRGHLLQCIYNRNILIAYC